MADHGAQTCPRCDGYLSPLGQLGRRFILKCRDCGSQFGHEMKNTLEDVLAATVNDYDET